MAGSPRMAGSSDGEATYSRVCASLIGTSSCARSCTQRRAMGPTSLSGLNAFAVTTSQSNAHSRLSSFTFSVQTRAGEQPSYAARCIREIGQAAHV